MLLLSKLGPEGLKAELARARREELGGAEGVTADGIAAQVRYGANYSRKAQARARLLVDAQRHKPLLDAHICRLYEAPSIRSEILQHVNVSKNLQRQVTQRVAVAYSVPPARSLRGVPEAQESAFLKAYREAQTDSLAEQWGRYAFFLSVVHVIPRYERGKLTWVTVTPDTADALFDHESGDAEPSILVYETTAHGAVLVAVDSERWVWYSKDWKVVNEEEHGVGHTPWVAFRWQLPSSIDYWDREAGRDLYDATLEIGRVNAQMTWTRKHWSKKLLSVHIGTNTKSPENQNMGSMQPVLAEGDDAFTLTVHDTIVSVDQFIAEMAEIQTSALAAYGLTPEEVKNSKSEALIKIRNQQVKHFDRAELELAVRAGAVLRSAGVVTLTEAQIRESFRCKFAPLTDADHPKQRVETALAQMQLNATDPVEFYMTENPGVTRTEARECVEDHAKMRAELNTLLVSYNLSADPSDDAKTISQLNGKAGGQASGEARGGAPAAEGTAVVVVTEQPDEPIESEEPKSDETEAKAPAPEEAPPAALNGAQVTSLADLATLVGSGQMDPEVAAWLIGVAVPGLKPDEIKKAMDVAAKWAVDHPAPTAPGKPAAAPPAPEKEDEA